MLKKTAVVLLVLFIGLQFYRPAKNLSPAPGKADLAVAHSVPMEVQAILRQACYDCHSNHTVYPWYAEVQPVRWWLDSHIRDGKRHLNFSTFGAYDKKRAVKKLNELIEEVETGHMPPPSYTWMHRDARLTPAQVQLLVTWAEETVDASTE